MKKLTASLAALATIWGATAHAQGMEDPSRNGYYDQFKGKTVAFVPAAMGIDLTEGWAKIMQREAD